jgi:4-amino-4-deoxy-L-arabinose transferase-like glycosyltransferase
VRLNRKMAILLVLICALVFRLVFAVWAVGLNAPPRGDEINYQDHAANIAAGKGMIRSDGQPSSFRPPLFPLAIGGLYRLFGVHLALARTFQILVGVAVVALTYLLARRLFSPGVALVAASLVAVNPYLILMSSYLLTEILYTALLLAGLLALEAGRSRGREGAARLAPAALAGLLFGLATLTRANAGLLVVMVVGGVAALGSGGVARRLGQGAVVLVAVAAALAPWAIRNHARLGEWVLLTTNGGMTFYQCNNSLVLSDPALYGSVGTSEALPGWSRIQQASEVEGDREAWRLGKVFLKENPGVIPKLAWRKFLRFWRFQSHAPFSGVKSGWWWNRNTLLGALASKFDPGLIYSVVVLPSFLLGIVLTAKRYREVFFLYATVVAHVLVALVFFGSLRARLPIEPVIAILAAGGMVWVAARVRRRCGRPRLDTAPREGGL